MVGHVVRSDKYFDQGTLRIVKRFDDVSPKHVGHVTKVGCE